MEKIIKKRACIRMSVGTALVILFSDPMVDVLSAWRNVLGISPSYISVVLAPLALVHCKGLAWQFKAETISIMVIQWIIGALAYFCSTHATTIGIGIYRFDPDEMAEPFLPNCTIDLNEAGPMIVDALIKVKDEADTALTLRRSCRERWWNMFDTLVMPTSIVEAMVNFFPGGSADIGVSAFRTCRVSRIVRLFRVAGKFTVVRNFKTMFYSIMNSLRHTDRDCIHEP